MNYIVRRSLTELELRTYLHYRVTEEHNNSDCIKWHQESHTTATLLGLVQGPGSHGGTHARNRSRLNHREKPYIISAFSDFGYSDFLIANKIGFCKL